MTKINKVFDEILICVKLFYFNYVLYFRFPLHNSTGEARPHLPPLTASPCIVIMPAYSNSNSYFRSFLEEDKLNYP